MECYCDISSKHFRFSFVGDFIIFITRGQLWPSDIVIVCVCLCVYVCVRQSSVCPDDNLWPAQATITKIGPEVQNTLVKIPIVFGGSLTLAFKVKLNLKVTIYSILGLWVCPGDKSIPHGVRLSTFGSKMHLSTVKVPIDFGIDWSWSSVSFLTSNLLYSTKFCVSYSFASFCIYLVRPWPVSVPHPTRLRTESYARGQGPAIDLETVYFFILVRSLQFSQSRLGDWHWILQAVIGFRPIIYTSHVEILYTNIRQSPKQQ